MLQQFCCVQLWQSTMPSFFQEWNRLELVQKCTQDVNPIAAQKEFQALDTRIREQFMGSVQQYEQGLLHSVEFFQQLMQILDQQQK